MARKKSALSILLGGSSRRKSKGFFGTLIAGQKRTERRNRPHSPMKSSSSKRKY